MPQRILLIEDEARIRAVVQACLEDLGGWEVQLAESGTEGLNLAIQQLFDVILLDISMPDIDGFQIYNTLQATPRTQAVSIILLTAKTLPSDHDRFAQMDVAGIILKPFNPLLLCQQIRDILGWTE
ncbi:MAG: response regulator [Kaiparowitsia implicata GSE-PSE-MK54-09C]|jgi:CheY-like chemotaxis protein|nr:response regulator [Kaiparowitsia implicata GSE-PSE-MK54-09C]